MSFKESEFLGRINEDIPVIKALCIYLDKLVDGGIDDLFYRNIINDAAQRLYYIGYELDYLTQEIESQGKLTKCKNGRYAFESDYNNCFTCGRSIEVYIPSEYRTYDDGDGWVKTRIEYDHKKDDYIAYGYSEFDLEGARVRTRIEPRWYL